MQDLTMSTVKATVEDVLPGLGMAYLAGDDHREWTITRSTSGGEFSALRPGQRIDLTIEHHARCDAVCNYAVVPLNS